MAGVVACAFKHCP